MTKIKPLFIVGTGRSGTTLLRAILNAHPDLHIAKESSFFLRTSPATFQKNPRQEMQRYFRSAPFCWLQLPPTEVEKLLPSEPKYGDFLKAVLQADAQRYGKKNWGDKTPAHWLHLEQIYACCPDAVIINLIRDPRKVVASLLRMPWGSPSVIANAIYYERCLRLLLPDPKVKNLLFEDLIREPEPFLKQILEWIGLEWNKQLMNHIAFTINDIGGLPWLVPAYQPLKKQTSLSLDLEKEALVEKLCPTAFQKLYQAKHQSASPKSVFNDLPALFSSLKFLLKLKLLPPHDGEQELRAWLQHNKKAFSYWPGWDVKKVVEASFN